MQRNRNKLLDRSDKCQQNFNAEKCTSTHIGTLNRKSDYLTTEQHLSGREQRDLGMLIDNDLKRKIRVDASFEKFNKVLSFIYRIFHFKHKDNMFPMYVEYAIPFWSLLIRGDINKMEGI